MKKTKRFLAVVLCMLLIGGSDDGGDGCLDDGLLN